MGISEDEPTYPCRLCGRKFIRSSLDKHEPVCKKLTNLNRKPFDSGKQRATGSDITIQDVRKARKEKEQAGGQFPRPKTNWRERHTTFIEAVSASKKVDYAIKTGAPLPPPPKASVPSEYVQCEYCGRNFNENAAERHIPFCREQHSRKGPLKPASKPLTAHRPLASALNRERSDSREQDNMRNATSRGARRASTESRARTRTSSSQRPTANSAGPRETVPPVTPARRSNSAPRTPHAPSRLKQPVTPGTGWGERHTTGHKERRQATAARATTSDKNHSKPPKTPKTANSRPPMSRDSSLTKEPKSSGTSHGRRTGTSRSRAF